MTQIIIVLLFVVVVEAIAIGIISKEVQKAEDMADGALTIIANMSSAEMETHRQINADIDDVRNYITEVETELLEKIDELRELYDAADEMIRQVTRTAEEAQATEKKMQEGIDAILNYNSQKAIENSFGR